ncbi:MAG: ATP-binding protein [Vicinamibacteria bacterium]
MTRLTRSIGWRLQLWHAALLAMVLAGFGGTAWRLERDTQLRRLDQELERRVAVVADALRRGEVRLPPRDDAVFTGGPGDAFYFVAWDGDGLEVARSASAPSDVPWPAPGRERRSWRSRGTAREYCHCEPSQQACILIGHDAREELADVRRAAWFLASAGAVVFVVGCAVGWWITREALRPIGTIGATAARIAAGELDRRVPVDAEGSELDELARVLNETFDRLHSALERQKRFTADASHELRTPLAVILTHAQAALARERPAADYRESFVACRNAAQRMRHLLEGLLTLARLDGGHGDPPGSACELDRVARETVELLSPVAAERGVTLAAEVEPVCCVGDPEPLGQVVTNLVTNAIQHEPPGGRVTVAVSAEKNAAMLSVRDTGAGIPAEHLPHIFERFYRVDSARSGAGGRVGLGLAIVKAIVESRGGSVRAASTPGQGSVFTVRLPLAPGTAADPPAESS